MLNKSYSSHDCDFLASFLKMLYRFCFSW